MKEFMLLSAWNGSVVSNVPHAAIKAVIIGLLVDSPSQMQLDCDTLNRIEVDSQFDVVCDEGSIYSILRTK